MLNSPHPAENTIRTLDSLSAKLSPNNPEVSKSYEKAMFSTSDYINILSFIIFLIVALNLNLENNAYIFYKLSIFIAVSIQYLIFKAIKQRYAMQAFSIILFIIFGSSVAFHILMPLASAKNLESSFHMSAENNDMALNSICISIAYSYFKFPTEFIKKTRTLYLILVFVKFIFIQIAMKTFSTKLLLYNFFYVLIIWTQFHFVDQRLQKERESLIKSWSKTSADVQQDIMKLKQSIEDAYKHFSSSSTSDADKLLMKLKFLRFELMVEERQFTKAFKKSQKKLIEIDNSHHDKKNGVIGSNELDENEDDLGNSPKNSWKLTTKDVDSIIQYLLSTKTALWMPHIKLNGLSQEATDFVMTHFTENFKELPEIPLKNIMTESRLSNPKVMDMNPLNNYIEANLFNWGFDMFVLKDLSRDNHLVDYGYSAFRKFNIQNVLNTDTFTIQAFLRSVQSGYRKNPYHNALHGADVANSVGFFIVNGLEGYYNPLEISCLIISALVHDISHPGLNNAFLVSTKSPEALIYNDMSVLENYHATTFFKILNYDQSNILKGLNDKEWKLFRKLAISVILDTDLGKHFTIMNKFKNMIALKQYNMKEENDRHLVFSIALKCADIAHGAKELHLHKRWSRRIIEEFYMQGDKEMEASLAPTPMCDRKGNISKGQEGFLKVICLPLFQTFEEFFISENIGEQVVKTCVPCIKKNLKYWEEEQIVENQNKGTFLTETDKIIQELNEEMKRD